MSHGLPTRETPIRILHIFGKMERGGAEMRTLDVMRQIDPRQYQLHFCALSGESGELDEEIRMLGGEVHLTRLDARFARRFRHLLRQFRPDVVHSHVHHFSGFILRLAAQEKVPVRIAHFRGTDDSKGNGLRRLIQRRVMKFWINRHATHILAVAQGVLDAAWGPKWKSDPRCKVIYNGLDLRRFSEPRDRSAVRSEFGVSEDDKLFIHVGRMVPEKNHARVVDIFAQVLKREPTARLLFVGRETSEIGSLIRTAIAEAGIGDKVQFAGVRSDVPRLLGAADLLIFPSHHEGLPGVVLESAASGTPVLASDLPGVIEIAHRLAIVHALPLEASDSQWASMAVQLAASPNLDENRQQSFGAFAATEFNSARAARLHCEVWGDAGLSQPKTERCNA